jgi:molybdopterin-containing oxidoreductase family membrane subunit
MAYHHLSRISCRGSVKRICDGDHHDDPGPAIFRLNHIITLRHIDNMCKIILVTGSVVRLCIYDGVFHCLVQRNSFETFAFINRASAPMPGILDHVTCNGRSPIFCLGDPPTLLVVWIISILVNVGMWFERFVIVVTALSRDFLLPIGDIIRRRLSMY